MATNPGAGRGRDNVVEIVIGASDAATKVVSKIVSGVAGLGDAFKQLNSTARGLTAISFAFNEISTTIGILKGTFSGAFDLFIGQNIQLQEQLLATQASLVATNQVFQGGIEIGDPSAAIQALGEPVRKVLEQIRKDSLELVGVTSAELVPVFQILASNASSVGASLQDAADLTIDFSAAFSVLGIEISAARQEIASVLQGTIDQNSALAKAIGLNNAQVQAWREQGVLVEELRKRLEAFRAGNAIAAATIGGVTSNIAEVIQETARLAGEPLLEPIVAQLTNLFKFLQANQQGIQDAVAGVVDFILQVGDRIGQVLQAFQPAAQALLNSLVGVFQSAAQGQGVILGLLDAVVGLAQAVAPLVNAFAELVEFFTADPVGKTVFQFVLLGGAALKTVQALVTFYGAARTAFFTVSLLQGALAAGNLKGFLAFASGAGGATKALLFFQSVAKSSLISGLVGTLSAAAAAFTAAGGGAAGAAAGIGVLAGSLKGLAIAAATAAAPFVVLAAAVATVAIAKTARDLQVLNNEIQNFQGQVDVASQQNLNLAQSFQALQEAEEAQGELTAEQRQQREQLIAVAQDQIDANNDLIESLKATREEAKNDEQRNALDAQIATIERTQETLEKYANSVTLAANPLEELNNRITAVNNSLQQQTTILDAGTSQALANLTEQLNRGVVSESQFQQEREKITREGLQNQLKATQEGLSELQEQYDKLSPEQQAQAREQEAQIAQLTKQAADLRGQIAQSEFDEKKTLREKEVKDVDRALADQVTAQTEAEAELQRKRNEGLISEAELQRERLKLTEQRISQELAAEEERLALLQQDSSNNVDEINATEQKIADLKKQRAENERSASEAEIAIVEEAQERALQAVVAAETERQIEIQKLRNAGAITETEAQEQILEATQNRIQEELRLEQERLQQLESAGGNNEGAIRESRQRILDLTKQSLETEEQLYDAFISTLRDKLGRQAQSYANLLEAQTLELTKQQQIIDSLDAAFANRNRLLQAGKDLLAAQTSAVSSQFSILAGLETSEIRRRKLNQAAAIAELESLREQQRIEQQLLVLAQQQEQAALRRRQIENDIAIARSQAELARGDAELQVSRQELAGGRISQEEFNARVLGQQSRQAELQGLLQQRGLLQEEGTVLQQTQALQQRQIQQANQTAIRQAQAEVIQSAAPGDRRALRAQLEQELLGSSTNEFLRQNQALLQQAQNQIFSSQSTLLDRLAPDRLRPEQALQMPTAELAPQLQSALAPLQQLQPLQSAGNGLLQRIADGVSTLIDVTRSGGQVGAAPQITLNAPINAPVATNSADSEEGVLNQLRGVIRQARQLAVEGT